jgi:hypothetical protein
MEDSQWRTQTTSATSIVSTLSTIDQFSQGAPKGTAQGIFAAAEFAAQDPANVISQRDMAMNYIVISLIGFVGAVITIVILICHLRYTNAGPKPPDWRGRHCQYDEEKALTLDEAEASEEVDDLSFADHIGAKGTFLYTTIYE